MKALRVGQAIALFGVLLWGIEKVSGFYSLDPLVKLIMIGGVLVYFYPLLVIYHRAVAGVDANSKLAEIARKTEQLSRGKLINTGLGNIGSVAGMALGNLPFGKTGRSFPLKWVVNYTDDPRFVKVIDYLNYLASHRNPFKSYNGSCKSCYYGFDSELDQTVMIEAEEVLFYSILTVDEFLNILGDGTSN